MCHRHIRHIHPFWHYIHPAGTPSIRSGCGGEQEETVQRHADLIGLAAAPRLTAPAGR
jgi:hypothetical protein